MCDTVPKFSRAARVIRKFSRVSRNCLYIGMDEPVVSLGRFKVFFLSLGKAAILQRIVSNNLMPCNLRMQHVCVPLSTIVSLVTCIADVRMPPMHVATECAILANELPCLQFIDKRKLHLSRLCDEYLMAFGYKWVPNNVASGIKCRSTVTPSSRLTV